MAYTEAQKQAFAELAQDRSQRDALAKLLVEYIKPNHLTGQFMDLLLKTRQLQPGDALVKKLRKGIEVRTLVPGSSHLASEITVTERMNYILDGADVKVTFNEWELERGDIGSLSEIRSEMNAKLADYYFNKVFTALTTVWTAANTPNNYTSLGTNVTASSLEDAIDEINYRGGGAKLVIGTQRAMQPITKFAGFWAPTTTAAGTPHVAIPSAIEEVKANGFIGRYYGVELMKIPQIWDNPEDYNALLPENKILVIGHDVGEFITYGPERTKQWTDMNPTPPQWFLEIYQQFGMIIDNAQGLYVIGVTPS